MAKLTLKFGDHALKEVAIGPHGVRIGRLPDNTIHIDNPAVSSHHARVFPEGDKFIIEDLKSTNGTYINETRVTRQTLNDGDVMLIGKHTVVFDLHGGDAPMADEPEAEGQDLDGGTVYLDTKRQRELLAKMGVQAPSTQHLQRGGGARGDTVIHPPPGGAAQAPAPAPAKIGVLRVLAGKTDKTEYSLDAHTSLVGGASTATVRLLGWFKPNVAVSISRKGDVYTATKLGGSPTINHQPLTARHDMKDGDVIQVSGVTLEFHVK